MLLAKIHALWSKLRGDGANADKKATTSVDDNDRKKKLNAR